PLDAASELRPTSPVVGTLAETGLATRDRIAAGGVAPTPENPTPVDGAPALPVRIVEAAGQHP
ncbi:MAG TPA: peptidylprolyl isomerase, partial [Micromonospora sp.]